MSDQPLLALWEASANSPFIPAVGKDAQFLVAFVLLSIGFVLTALFGLSMHALHAPLVKLQTNDTAQTSPLRTFPSSPSQHHSPLRSEQYT